MRQSLRATTTTVRQLSVSLTAASADDVLAVMSSKLSATSSTLSEPLGSDDVQAGCFPRFFRIKQKANKTPVGPSGTAPAPSTLETRNNDHEIVRNSILVVYGYSVGSLMQ